ncbi:uromodulin-like 1 [Sardina pilchardus]|uniref:uromodulin-like 1 n=1 Tax=Sardina pilchardus TaxID=27697 RepID=UPI002E106EE2
MGGYELSMRGYHLCAVNRTTVASSVLSYQTSYTQRRSCGGWLPWRTCEVTLYRVAYRSHPISLHREVMQCCPGYEQVGSYCALPLNCSAVFTAKPGSCPKAWPNGSHCGSQPQCGLDTDCAGWQKCCPATGGHYCADPQPPDEQGWCFNATVTVKLDYQQMMATETGLLNHTRLLHSVVTGALNCSDMSVRHVVSWSAGPHVTSSSLLIGSSSALVLADVSSRLQSLLRHIEEVVAVAVQDMDDCAHRELSKCLPNTVCINTVGSYTCSSANHSRSTTTEPPSPGATTAAAVITSALTKATVTNTEGSPHRVITFSWSIAVACNPGYMSVSVARDFLRDERMSDDSLYLGLPECGVNDGNASHVLLVAAWDECDTVLMSNSTHTTTEVKLYNNMSSHSWPDGSVSMPSARLKVPILCSYINSIISTTVLPPLVSRGQDEFTSSGSLGDPWSGSSSSPPPETPPAPSVTSEPLHNFTCNVVPEIVSINAFNITSSSFSVSWTTASSPGPVTFQVMLLQGSDELRSWQTAETEMEQRQLPAGVLYRVCVVPHACGVQGAMDEILVKTDAQVLQAVARLTNMNFTESLLDSESPEYKNLSQSIQDEIRLSLPPDIQALVDSGEVRIVITGFSQGSVVVDFTLVFEPKEDQDIMGLSRSIMASLQNSSKYAVDSNTTSVQDLNECISRDVDCSSEAECVNTMGGYDCVCNDGFEDMNPSWPGRSCIALSASSSVTILPPPITTTQSVYTTTLSTDDSDSETTPSVISTTHQTHPTTTISATPTTEGPITPPEPVTSTPSDKQMTPGSFHITSLVDTTASTLTRKPTSHSGTSLGIATAPYISTTATTAATTKATVNTTTTTTTTSAVTYSELMTNTLNPINSNRVGNPAILIANLTTTQTNANTALTNTLSTTTTTSAHPVSTTTNAKFTIEAKLTTDAKFTTIPTTANSLVTTTTSDTTKAVTTSVPSTSTTLTTTKTIPTSPVITTSSTTNARVTNAVATTTTSTPIKAMVTNTQMSQTPQTSQPIQVISQSATITVVCNPGYMSVSVARDFLRGKHMSDDSLYLGLRECGVNGGNASHVLLVAAWDECDTVLQSNSTHNTAEVTLSNDMSSHTWPDGSVSMPSARLQVPILCSYINSIVISAGYSPQEYDMIKDVVQGSGSFHVTVRLLNGTVPLPENYTLSPDEEVVVEVSVNSTIRQIKVVLNRCWATPTNNPSGPTEYVFLKNGCPLPEAYTTVLQNGNDSKALLAVQIFSLVDVDVNVIYLHCQIQICFKTGESSCRPDCMESGASLGVSRLANLVGAAKASCGPFHRLYHKGTVAQGRDTLLTLGFSLLGVGLGLLLLAGVVGLLLYKRRIGAYNFNSKTQPENFTYHVFDT